MTHKIGGRLVRCKFCKSENIFPIRETSAYTRFKCSECKRLTIFRHPQGYDPGRESPRSFVVFDHQGKDGLFSRILESSGYCMVPYTYHGGYKRKLAFVLTDHDIMGRANSLSRIRRLGWSDRFFVYPHTARPNLTNDIRTAWEHTTAQFVVSQGHAEIMQRYDYPKPLHPIGWYLCEIKKFRPRSSVRKVLFAPIHPRNADCDKEVNARVYDILTGLAAKDEIDLKVRYIRSMQESGIKTVINHPNITYKSGAMDQDYSDIDGADIVIGHQTFAYMAVARGVPTVMMAERSLKTHIVPLGKPVETARHWDDYIDLLAYPHDILDAEDVMGLFNRVAGSDDDILDWRRRMIGDPFDPDKFVSILESYL